MTKKEGSDSEGKARLTAKGQRSTVQPDPRARAAGGDPDFRRQVDDEIPSER